MSVRISSAQRTDIHFSFPVARATLSLITNDKSAAVSSPKAKVTRSNRLGRAKYRRFPSIAADNRRNYARVMSGE